MVWTKQEPNLPPAGDALPFVQLPFGTRAELFFGIGVAVSADGTTMAVGAPNDGEDTTLVLAPPAPAHGVDHTYGTGAVFIYSLDADGNATYVSKIRSTGIAAHTGPIHFGQRVALSDDGNTLAVAAPGDGASQQPDRNWHGSVFVYERDIFGGWTRAAQFEGHGGESDFWNRSFGESISLSGDGTRLLIGADTDGGVNFGEGAVYICEKPPGDVWQELQKIDADGGGDLSEQFGTGCAISSDGEYAVVVSTRGGDDGGGAAYCYKWSSGAGISLEEKINIGGLPNETSSLMSANMNADGTTICIARDKLYFFARTGATWEFHDSSELLDVLDGVDGYVGYSAEMLSSGDLVFARQTQEGFGISKGWIIEGSGVAWALDDIASEFDVGYGVTGGLLTPRIGATLPRAAYTGFYSDGAHGSIGSVLIWQDVPGPDPPPDDNTVSLDRVRWRIAG